MLPESDSSWIKNDIPNWNDYRGNGHGEGVDSNCKHPPRTLESFLSFSDGPVKPETTAGIWVDERIPMGFPYSRNLNPHHGKIGWDQVL